MLTLQFFALDIEQIAFGVPDSNKIIDSTYKWVKAKEYNPDKAKLGTFEVDFAIEQKTGVNQIIEWPILQRKQYTERRQSKVSVRDKLPQRKHKRVEWEDRAHDRGRRRTQTRQFKDQKH